MRNAYFKLVRMDEGYGIRFFPAQDGGEGIRIQEVCNYLENANLIYNLNGLKEAAGKAEENTLKLGDGECPNVREYYDFNVAEDNMLATARFYPASDTGERMNLDEFIKDMQFRMIKFGLQEKILRMHFDGPGYYCIDLPVIKGQQPRHGTDARIEYFFNTDIHAKPELQEDGSVDFFHLGLIEPVKAGQKLAQIIPEDPGEYGMNILGSRIKPREVKKARLDFGRNIKLSEDRLSICSEVNGHVMYVGGQVFVSNVYEVENVDNSTGNIDYDGDVKVNGNVNTNFEIKATGNVVVNGVVEGALIEAGGDIIIARGMNGQAKGRIVAGKNIVAKFFENANVEAKGYVHSESILLSNVIAGEEVVVTGRRGFITGGHVQAEKMIEVKTLGGEMGAATTVEVGVNPVVKKEYNQVQKDLEKIAKTLKDAQPIVQNFMEKKAKGVRFTEEQLAYIKQTVANIEVKKNELIAKNARLKELAEQVNPAQTSEVHVTGVVYPGTTIIIGDVSMTVQSAYKYCRFVKAEGDVKMRPL